MFPGYAFVRLAMTPETRVRLLKVKGVFDVVGRKPGLPGVAPPIPDEQLASLQRLVASARAIDPLTALAPGRLVVVAAGPLRGVRGVVEEGIDGHRRLVVNVTLLGRAVRTVLQADDVVEAPSVTDG